MPIHDWARVPSGLFHDFHQSWTVAINSALNRGNLPSNLAGIIEQKVNLDEPQARASLTSNEIYAARANRITIKHNLRRTIAIIEIVSPGNKARQSAVADVVSKVTDFLRKGIHVLIIDLFPPTSRDPLGMHMLIWEKIGDGVFSFPPGKDRILASFETGEKAVYIEPIGVGDSLPDMPLFVAEGIHVKVPLESTYQSAWDACPELLQEAVKTGTLPEPDPEEV